MALSAKGKTRTAPSKNNRPVTLKHLAATLAEEHQLTKKAGEALLGDLVGRITKHLKKGERIRISGLGIWQVRKAAGSYGSQSCNRRSNPDQGKQESRIPGG